MLKSITRLSLVARSQSPASISHPALPAAAAAVPSVLARSFHASSSSNKQKKVYSTADVASVSGVPHLLTDNDLSPKQLSDIIQSACQFKHQAKVEGKPSGAPLAGKTMALMFSKRSTRTRVATETAVAYLGGHAMFLGSQDIQLGVNESLLDTSKVVSSMVDGIMARVGAHSEIEVGMHISMATPKGYEPNADILSQAKQNAQAAGTEVGVFYDPKDAIRDADIIVTDTWISMGQEEEKKQRIQAFAGYQLTTDLIEKSGAKQDWKFLHCLPRKQEEVTDDVFYSPRSHVFQEAENRKWTILACINQLLVKKGF
ncbi:ornithine carbamoyltransferase [Mortierella alpina]|nr:ornithine carbamoyltransferase [Mortierella alpina]